MSDLAIDHLKRALDQSIAGAKRAEAQAIELQRLTDERNSVTAERDQLRVETRMLREQLAEAKRSADFYQRHSMTLVTRLSDVCMVCDQAMQEAKDAAYAPSLAVPQQIEPPPQANDKNEFDKAIGAILSADGGNTPVPSFLRNGPAEHQEKFRLRSPENP